MKQKIEENNYLVSKFVYNNNDIKENPSAINENLASEILYFVRFPSNFVMTFIYQ